MPRKQRAGLRVVKRAGTSTLYLRGTVRGQRIFESAGTDIEALAEEARAARETELYRSAIYGTKPRVTFAAAAVSYLQADARSETTKVNVGKIVRHFGPTTTCDQIDQERMDQAGRAICRAGAKPQSIARQVITPAKAILSHAARRGWCDMPRFERVRAGGRRTDWITPTEAEAMLANAHPRFTPLLTFLICTGARVGEAIDLVWDDVDLRHARAVLRDTKNGDDRPVSLPPRAVAALANIPTEGDKRTGPVFLSHRGVKYRSTTDTERGAEGGQIKRVFASALKAAGITRHLTPHHCRHTWATWHYCLHRDPLQLRDDGGWRSLSQVERYTKLAPQTMRDEIMRVLGFGGAQAVPGADSSKLTA